MRHLTDTAIRGLLRNSKRSEQVEPVGSLLIWHRSNGTKEFYFRRRQKGEKELSIKLGTYPSISLATARQNARKMAEKAATVHDLKFVLSEEVHHQKLAENAAKKAKERAESLGSLSDLCAVYIEKMRSDKRTSWRNVEAALKRYVLDPFPQLAKCNANEITSDDIAEILKAMVDKGITTNVNRTRGDLHATFNVGISYEYTPTIRTKEGLCFDIQVNPVTRIKPIKKWERALSRNLGADELQKVWEATPVYMSPVYSALFRLMICTGFHPAELLRLKVKDVDLQEGAIYMTETKSGAPNLIPLNCFAWTELADLIAGSDPEADLFPSRVSNPRSDTYSRVSVVANQVARLRNSLDDVEHFTARDIRRTVKTLMGKAGISKEIRDRLQNHSVNDVSGKHYDRYDYWKEKRAAMLQWERWLAINVIKQPTQQSNVVYI